MVDYNMIYFWTLIFPLATMLAITMAGYLDMRNRYIVCRLKYDKEFRESEKGKALMMKLKKREKRLDWFRYKDVE